MFAPTCTPQLSSLQHVKSVLLQVPPQWYKEVEIQGHKVQADGEDIPSKTDPGVALYGSRHGHKVSLYS